ncbi:TPA: hypothetical protein ACF3LP_000091 [Enterococcus faecium]
MSNLKVGDIVFYKGDEGIIREVMTDGKENFYRVDVSRKSILYLYEDELDLGTKKLNENQQIVLEYLKSKITESSVNPINAIVILGHLWEFRRFNTEEECLVLEAYWQLNSKQQVEVLQAFSAWVLEEEEEE